MRNRDNQKSLAERWAMDIESYNQGAKTQISSPQCKSCKFRIQSDAFHCEIFVTEEKPDYVVECQKECTHYQNITPLKLNDIPLDKQVLFAGIFGFIVGDALGVPAEFSPREERIGDPYREMRAYGTYHQGFGTWSDDSSLTMCLIDAISGGYSLDKLAQNLISYYSDAAFTPNDELFDIGIGTQNAIKKMIQKVPLNQVGGKGERDNGNGSLMRVLPIAYLVTTHNYNELIHMTEEVSALTHANPVSQFACIFYVLLASKLLKLQNKKKAIESTIDYVKQNLSVRYDETMQRYARIFSGEIFVAKQNAIRSSGYVVDTLEAVLWLFTQYDSYEAMVLAAINLGGDTDTIAAIVGGLAGIYYGLCAIPERWIQVLPKKEEIAELLMGFPQS